MKRVIVQDYDPAWPEIFDQLCARIWPAVSDIAISVEHVGSTAVPGLAAKPIIDMDVIVPPIRVAEGILHITALGYTHRGDLGISKREAFAAPAGMPKHHLYLCPSDSQALANHLAVRDALRTSSDDARAYGELKKRLALMFAHDIDRYIEGKTDFLLRLLERAGFSAEARADIRRRNVR